MKPDKNCIKNIFVGLKPDLLAGTYKDKKEIDVYEYLDNMLKELYLVIFNKEKYSWLSNKNKKRVEIHLRYAVK